MSFFFAQNVKLKCLPNAVINFELERGEAAAVIGRNGIGKSTLFRSIIGETSLVDGGFVAPGLTGQVQAFSPEVLSRFIAYMPQEAIFPADLRVEDYLLIGLLPRKLRSARESFQSIQEVLTKLQLGTSPRRMMSQLSSGERQRVHLARVLLQETPLLLLDEPTNHLDPEAKELFWKLLKEEQTSRQCAALIITHDLELAAKNCRKLLSLSEQGVVQHTG